MNDKILNLARKLKALAEAGVGGEKANAKDALLRFMQKHNITLEQLEGVQKNKEVFKYTTAEHKKFIFQVIASVSGKHTDIYTYRGSTRKEVIAEVTKAEFVEIQSKTEFFWRLYQQEYKIFYTAFIQVNKLYSKPDGTEADEPKEMSPEERAELLRIMQMMDNIQPGQYHKQLSTVNE